MGTARSFYFLMVDYGRVQSITYDGQFPYNSVNFNNLIFDLAGSLSYNRLPKEVHHIIMLPMLLI